MKINFENYVKAIFPIIIMALQITFNYSYAQDVIVTVKPLQNTVAVPVDSIIIFNETNKSYLKLGSLSQTSNSYKINLNKSTVEGITGIHTISDFENIEITPATAGFNVIAQTTRTQNMQLSVYTIDGKFIDYRNIKTNPGTNNIPVQLNQTGIYILKVATSYNSVTFKILYTEKGVNAIKENNLTVSTSKQKSIQTNFTYTAGDRIQVVLKKGTIKSPTWLGKPVNGNILAIALPISSNLFNMKQTLSSGAQINTISFSGVAFFSGCYYASSFYPPGKVADYFGFQYMRDNDPDESGHNTDFLTKVAYHMMHILNQSQMQILIDLASSQEALFNEYALKRLILIKAFHRYLDNDLPAGTTTLNFDEVKRISRELYLIDGEISYGRAIKFAQVINSLTEEQRDTLYKLGALGMKTWPMPSKPTVSIPQGLNTWVMSNASELFSWFLRDVEADIYFCPERQGTYFGGFYMKDAPAVNNPGYAIDPQATAQKGEYMLSTILTTSQSTDIKNIYTMVKPSLENMVKVRDSISVELRKAIAGQSINKTNILNWSGLYGEYDATYIYSMVMQFVKVGRTLTTDQKDKLITLRDLKDFPCKSGKVFLYSAEITEPTIPNTDFLFK